MKRLSQLLFALVASAAFFIASSHAQNSGTVTQNAFAIGKGAGDTGYASLLCGSAQLAVGQSAAAPICQTITGDVTLSAAGVTALGNIPSGTTMAGSLLATAIAAPTTPAAGKDSVWIDSTDKRLHDKNDGGTIGTTVVASTCSTSNWFRTMSSAGAFGCSQPSFTDLTGSLACTQHPALTGDVTSSAGSCATTIAANAVTNAKMATMNAWTIKMNNTSGTATPTDTTIDGLTLKASPASSDEIPIWDASGTSMKKATVSSIASAGSVGSFNGRTGAVVSASGDYTAFFPGGDLNRFRNGTFAIFQRGVTGTNTSTSAGGAYTADGWRAQQTTANGPCGQDVGPGAGLPPYSLKCLSNSTSGDTIYIQRIEGSVAAPLAGQTVTFQIRYKQTGSANVTPKISTCYASVTDNFSTCTSDLASTSLVSCASGVWCVESYTFNASSNAANGYEVDFDCNVSLTGTNACWIAAADIRVTPGVTTGVNSNPPPMEQRPIQAELAFCQRYFIQLQATIANMSFALAFANASTQVFATIPLPVTMRTAPSFGTSGSFQYVSAGSTFTGSSVAASISSAQSPVVSMTVSGATAGTAGFFRDNGSANAVMQFSAEL